MGPGVHAEVGFDAIVPRGVVEAAQLHPRLVAHPPAPAQEWLGVRTHRMPELRGVAHGDLENLVGDGVGARAVPMFLAICVSMIPGSTMATRMLNALTSWARHSLSASSANLDAVYAAIGDVATWPATEATLMMHPLRRCLIAGRTAWQQRMTPK